MHARDTTGDGLRKLFGIQAYSLHAINHAPQLRIQIPLPAKTRKIDATLDDYNAFDRESLALFAETLAAGRKRDAAIGTQNPVPWQFQTRIGFAQDPPHQARSPRQAGALCDFAITCHAAARYRRDGSLNGGMFRFDLDRN